MSTVEIRENDGLVTISVHDRFDFSAYEGFSACYKWYPVTSRYMIDMKHVRYIDSSALTMMLLLRGHVQNRKQNVIIANCNADIRKLLTTSGFERLFDIQ